MQNYLMIISMRIRMQGFVVFDYAHKYAEARKELAQWLSEGKLKRKETIIKGGISKAEEALVGLFEGKNTGKLTVSIEEHASIDFFQGKTMVEVAKPDDVKSRL
jgi:NADPH-dependent curcumin reductase CurA